MREIKAMTKRNLLIYFRNKSAVFFSILSALILLAIMVVFLGESSSEGLLDALNQYGTGTAEENARKRTVTFILCDTSKSFLSVTGLYFVSLG